MANITNKPPVAKLLAKYTEVGTIHKAIKMLEADNICYDTSIVYILSKSILEIKEPKNVSFINMGAL